MKIIQGNRTVDTLLQMYAAVYDHGFESTTRGSKTREVHDLAVVFSAVHTPLTSFDARKLNLNYCKEEWLWYLRADAKDSSIMEHATMWAKLMQEDGSFYSNYGQYLFGEQHLGKPTQFEYVARTLEKESTSRRASMVLLRQEHLFDGNTDLVCTYGINFFIVNEVLHMTVMMRSNDVIFGFTNDAFCFHQLYMCMFSRLSRTYPNLHIGNYTHFTNSMHVYERHFDMIKQILADGQEGYTQHELPWPSADEVSQLMQTKGGESYGVYSDWLRSSSTGQAGA